MSTKEEILRIGLKMEQGACDFYRRQSEALAHPGAKVLLRELQAEEEVHVKLFEDMLAGRPVNLGAGAPAPGQDLQIGEYLEEKPITPSSTPGEVLVVAIKSEMRAIKFYSESAAQYEGSELADLMNALVAEEKAHKAKLERLYDDEFLQEN